MDESPERRANVELPVEAPALSSAVDRPVAKLAYESVDVALAERADADREASTELDRPDWRSADWRDAEPELRAAWRSHEARWETAETGEAASEPTTDLVRAEGDLRYELGTPKDIPDELELDDGDKSAYERARNEFTKHQTVGNIDDAGAEWVGLFEGVLDDRPQPSGAYVGTLDHPVIRQAPREAVDGGALVVAPIVSGR